MIANVDGAFDGGFNNGELEKMTNISRRVIDKLNHGDVRSDAIEKGAALYV